VITVVPFVIPETWPIAETVAIDGLLLLHVPQETGPVNIVVSPAHIDKLPLMVAGVKQLILKKKSHACPQVEEHGAPALPSASESMMRMRRFTPEIAPQLGTEKLTTSLTVPESSWCTLPINSVGEKELLLSRSI
jgi:hypothetical protein